MDRSHIEKIAQSPEDKLLLAKLWDKIYHPIQKNIPGNTCFLSPRELEMARFLFGQPEGLYAFGGYADAERKMLIFLPDYLEESALYEEDSPIVCLRCTFFQGLFNYLPQFAGKVIASDHRKVVDKNNIIHLFFLCHLDQVSVPIAVIYHIYLFIMIYKKRHKCVSEGFLYHNASGTVLQIIICDFCKRIVTCNESTVFYG